MDRRQSRRLNSMAGLYTVAASAVNAYL